LQDPPLPKSQTGREETWWASVSIDPLEIATKLWSIHHGSAADSL
jgi:hypothetical protein